jgi:probable F420-dependent oxidoreductase
MAFELGVVLPNYGRRASAAVIAGVADAAEELDFDSVWATEHVLVAAGAPAEFGRVLAPLATLAWLAGRTHALGLGTSILILPLHNPIHVAKEAATLQELSGGRFRLGVGIGWHEEEFGYLGESFADRSRRADEALRVIRALWSGERSFSGRYWSFEDASFAPLPAPPPPIWVGGRTERAIRRAREHDAVWHPSRVGPADVRRAKELRPDGVVVPRVGGDDADELARQVEALRAAGADGAVVSFGLEPERIVESMRTFARVALPALRG